MDIVETKINSIINFFERIYELIGEIIKDLSYVIEDMNAENQLYEQGITSKGVFIADYEPYSEFTIQRKKEEGKPYNRVTLRDEGDFESSFFVEVDNMKFEIKASDFKAVDLMKRYGEDIMGLTESNLNDLIFYYIYPELKLKLREQL